VGNIDKGVVGSLLFVEVFVLGHQSEQPSACVIPVHHPTLREFIFFFSCGFLVSIPFTLFFAQIYPYLPSLLVVAVLAPFIEELAKVFPLFYRHGETERSIVTLGLLIGLGFGIAEFVLYVFVLGVDPVVRVGGLIFHASSAAITSYGIAKKNVLPYYLLAVSLHGINNFFAAISVSFLAGGVGLLVLLVVFWMAWRVWHRASRDRVVS
jgi:RsiW-degrading membrane proteinase PrsW (M82 family)